MFVIIAERTLRLISQFQSLDTRPAQLEDRDRVVVACVGALIQPRTDKRSPDSAPRQSDSQKNHMVPGSDLLLCLWLLGPTFKIRTSNPAPGPL